MDHFRHKVIIAYFVGGRQSARATADWAHALSQETKEVCKIGRELGYGFFQVVTNGEAATQRLLMLTPHLSKWGTCIMQPWIPNFKACTPTGIKMPIWITLKAVPDEFLSSSSDLAQSLGDVLGRHKGNPHSTDQRFCIAVKAGAPFVLTIGAVNPVTEQVTEIQVDYTNLPIRCRFCLSTAHLIKDCSVLGSPRRKPADAGVEDSNKQQQPAPETQLPDQQPATEVEQSPQLGEGEGDVPQGLPPPPSAQEALPGPPARPIPPMARVITEGVDDAGWQQVAPRARGRDTRRLNRASSSHAALDTVSWRQREQTRGYSSPPPMSMNSVTSTNTCMPRTSGLVEGIIC